MTTEAQVLEALAMRYGQPEYAFMTHVPDGIGVDRVGGRIVDAIAFGLWPSRGMELHGFEVKVSRSDWLRELKNPAKAEVVMGFCDRWWLVVGDAKIVEQGELPSTWGLLVPRGKRLWAKVEAPLRASRPVDRHMLATILRRATESMVPASVVEERAAALAKVELEKVTKRLDAESDRKTIDGLLATIANFQERSGIDITSYDAADVAAAARLVVANDRAVRNSQRAFEHQLRMLERALEQLRAVKRDIGVPAPASESNELVTRPEDPGCV